MRRLLSLFNLRIATFAVLVAAASVGYPPSQAQQQTAAGYDEGKRDEEIAEMVKFRDQQRDFNAEQDKVWSGKYEALNEKVVENHAVVNGLETEVRILFSILGLMHGSSLILTYRQSKKKVADALAPQEG